MKRTLLGLGLSLFLTGCSQLDSLLYSPRQTPESWLTIQPFFRFQVAGQSIIIVQPTTSALVYLLGIITIAAGLYFWRIRNAQQSRLWWGIALLLWGIGAILAGTSYEAFSYQIKCAGRETCMWTSWWEVGYLAVSVASVDAMLVAQAYSGATGQWRNVLIVYALTNLIGYIIAMLIGMAVPIQFLISFEFLLLVTAPNIIIFIIQNSWRYAQCKSRMDLALLVTWGWLVLTIATYFLYFISGLTQRLWAQGIWFSENDVLHIGLIVWMLYITVIIAPQIKDEPLINK